MHDVIDAPVPPSQGTSGIRAGNERWRIAVRNAFPFLVVGGLWELMAHVGGFPPRLFPPLEAVAAALYRLTVSGILPRHAGETILRLAAGFALAAIVGVAIGIAMGRSRRAEDVFLPLVSIGAPIPGVAYAPLFLLWFGLGNVSAVLLVAFVSTFPIIFNIWTGVKAVKEIWVRSAIVMGADNRKLFRHVILPGALPYIFAGMKVGAILAVAGAVVGEFLGSDKGLGYLMLQVQVTLDTPAMFMAVLMITAIGMLLYGMVLALERLLVVKDARLA